MAGDPSNASLWADADVYVAPTTATNPLTVDDPFGPEWDLVGLLDGEVGFVQAREEETTDHYAWGGVLVRTSRRNFKLTQAFTALEWNDTTKELLFPGSAPGEIVVPRPARVKIAFEMREGTKVRRLISAYEAEVVANGDIVENESTLTRYPLIATIFPDAQVTPPRLFWTQETGAASS